MSSEYFLIVIVAYFSTYDDCIDYKIWDSKILWVCGRKGVGGRSDLNVLVNMLTTPNAANELCAVIVIVTFSSS